MIAMFRCCTLLALSGFLVAIPGFADHWARVYGGLDSERAVGVELHPGGGYLVAGTSDADELGDEELWLMRVDSSGQIQWQKSYGGLGSDEACCLLKTAAGHFLLGGTTSSFGADGTDIWILELDAAGQVLWQKRYAEAGDQGLVDIDETSSGYLLTANREAVETSWNAWLVEIDLNGEIVWQKTYGDADGGNLVSGAEVFADDAIAMVGSSNSAAPGVKLWVVRLDSTGEISWQKTYGGSDLAELGLAIEAVGSDVVVAGYTEFFPYYRAPLSTWILRLDPAGVILSEKVYPGGGREMPGFISTTSDGGYILTGWSHTPRDAWIMKLGADFEFEWSRGYRGEDSVLDDFASSVVETDEGGFVLVGGTESFGLGEKESYDALALKLESDGTIADCGAVSDRFETAEDTAANVLLSAVTTSTTSATAVDTSVTPAATAMTTNDGCSVLDAFDTGLPETGQTTSYYPGDDGDLRFGVEWPEPRFQFHGDGTATDRLTGLMWLVDANCAHTIGHDPAGSGTGGMEWSQAVDFIAGINDGSFDISDCQSYGRDYDNWRMPNIIALESLVNLGSTSPANWLVAEGFANVQAAYFYWSSTMQAAHILQKHKVEFNEGRVSHDYASRWFYVWPVRLGADRLPDPSYPADPWQTGQTIVRYPGDDGDLQRGVAWPSPRFSDNGDGTVTDNLTKLVWLQDAACLGFAGFEVAHDRVAAFAADPSGFECEGYGDTLWPDWRVPNRKEVLSLIDWSRHRPKLPADHPFLNIGEGEDYLCSNTDAGNTSTNWTVYLSNGASIQRLKDWGAASVWAVRGRSPLLDIKANGSDGPLSVGDDQTVTVTLTLAAGDRQEASDWWVVARAPGGWYSWNPSDGWSSGVEPAAQAPPLDVLTPYEVLSRTLPSGDYTFYFALDDNADGNADVTWFDRVEVTVDP